jgi:hypothetical protein
MHRSIYTGEQSLVNGYLNCFHHEDHWLLQWPAASNARIHPMRTDYSPYDNACRFVM